MPFGYHVSIWSLQRSFFGALPGPYHVPNTVEWSKLMLSSSDLTLVFSLPQAAATQLVQLFSDGIPMMLSSKETESKICCDVGHFYKTQIFLHVLCL